MNSQNTKELLERCKHGLTTHLFTEHNDCDILVQDLETAIAELDKPHQKCDKMCMYVCSKGGTVRFECLEVDSAANGDKHAAYAAGKEAGVQEKTARMGDGTYQAGYDAANHMAKKYIRQLRDELDKALRAKVSAVQVQEPIDHTRGPICVNGCMTECVYCLKHFGKV